MLGSAALVLTLSQPAAARSPAASASPAGQVESETGYWVVSLEAPALAGYRGGVPGLAATSPAVTGSERLETTAPASVAYRDYLTGEQDALLDSIAAELGRPVMVAYQYLHVLNGLAVAINAEEAARIAALPGVEAVAPDSQRELTPLGPLSPTTFPNIWDRRASTASIVAAVDRAVKEGAALGYAVPGADGPWADMVDLAFRDAATAGLEVAAPAEAFTVDRYRLAATQAEGQVTAQTLAIGNPGDGAREWAVVGERTETPLAWRSRDGAVTITHSASQEIAELNSVACTTGGGRTTGNAYLRQFALAEFGITGGFEVTEVSFGIERVSGPPHPVTVHVYTMADPDGPLGGTNLAEIGSAQVEVTERALTTVAVPVNATATAGSTLVVEVETPDLAAADGGLFIGSGRAGQTAPSYLRSEACGLPEPTDVAEPPIDRSRMHVVMNVTGVAELAEPGCLAPEDVPWLDVLPRRGTIAPGERGELVVSFDSTGLAPGEYRALLCVDGDHPQQPRIELPVTLVVPEELAGCDQTITGVHDGPLAVSEGVTCLAAGSEVRGEVTVAAGAGLVTTGATIRGPVTATGAALVDVAFSRLGGAVQVSDGTAVSLFASRVAGPVILRDNQAGDVSITVSANTIVGALSCAGNAPLPTNHGLPNTVTTGRAGDCADL